MNRFTSNFILAKRMLTYAAGSLVLMSGLWGSHPAHAQAVANSYSGVLSAGATDTFGLFGPVGGDLSNQPFTTTYNYLPQDFSPNLCGSLYGSETTGALTVTLTVAQITRSFGSNNPGHCAAELDPVEAETQTVSLSAGVLTGIATRWYNGAPGGGTLANLGLPQDGSVVAFDIEHYTAGECECIVGTVGGLSVINPFRLDTKNLGNLDLAAILPNQTTADSATALAADGTSAAIVLFQVPTMDPVTFTTNNGTTLFKYEGNHNFFKKSPTEGDTSLEVKPISIGSLIYAVALLQAPPAGVTPSYSTLITITAQQKGGQMQQAYLPLVPPPVLLVHGLWGDKNSLSHIGDYLGSEAPYSSNPSLITAVGYPNYLAFDTDTTRFAFGNFLRSALASANSQGIVAGRVDVVAHSMGGLVVRHYSTVSEYDNLQNRNQGAVHQIVTLDTPEQGSALASFLIDWNQNVVNPPGVVASKVVSELCPNPQSNTAASCLEDADEPLGAINSSGAVFSLQPNSPNINALPSPAIPNSIWNVVSSTLTQTYDPRASSLLFGTNNLIASVCSGPNYCTNSSDQPAPTVEEILGTKDNDAVVTETSQSAGCVAPCQISTFRGLAHTKVPDLGVVGYIFNNRNVENNQSVDKVVACWLSTAGSSTCGASKDVASLKEVSFSPTDISESNQEASLEITPPASAQLAVPFEIPLQVVSGDLSALSVEQRDTFRHHTDDKEVAVRGGSRGNLYALVVPELMGRVTYRLRARFKDGSLVVKDATVLVGPPNSSLQSFRADGPFSVIHASLEACCNGGDLHYLTHPRATFSSTPGQEIDLDGWVTYKLLPSEGLPVIKLNSDGSFKALREGKAIVQEKFGTATYDITIAVDPPMH